MPVIGTMSFGRLISILSSISKKIERVAFDKLSDDILLHGLLYDSRDGFRKHHSIEMVVLELTDRIRHEMD